jgi:hypothetical protein
MRIRWCVIGLMATAMAFLLSVPAAQAINVPPPGENSGAAPSVIIHPAAVGGMAGWQIVLIAVGCALLASALTLLAVRARRAAPAQPSHPRHRRDRRISARPRNPAARTRARRPCSAAPGR